MAKAAPIRPRRTQAERRQTTRAALLDATIDCLVEFGYAGTTTTRVVERAGLSRGAQVHHFHTKAELVAEAVRHLAAKRVTELRHETAKLPDDGEKMRAALDLVWRTHSGPMFAASLELWIAARTDSELRASLLPVEREVIASIRELMAGVATVRGREVSDETLNVLVTLVLGVGLQTTLLSTRKAANAAWEAARDQLIQIISSPPPGWSDGPSASRSEPSVPKTNRR